MFGRQSAAITQAAGYGYGGHQSDEQKKAKKKAEFGGMDENRRPKPNQATRRLPRSPCHTWAEIGKNRMPIANAQK
jgi:hypothetical protein